MSIKKHKAAIDKLVADYQERLSKFSEKEFMQKPEEDVWCPGEVYSHVFDSSILSLIPIEEILNGKGIDGAASLAGKAILFTGQFPPGIRFKVPERLEGRVKRLNSNEAAALMEAFETALNKIYPDIDKADKALRSKHPRLGELNAEQWLRFIEVHLRHHLGQLERVTKSLQMIK